MKLLIEATDQLTRLDGELVRVWNGRTNDGQECVVFVKLIAVHESQDSSAFDRELYESSPEGRPADRRTVL